MQADIHLTLHRSDGLTAVRNSVRAVGLMDLNTRARRELLYVAISDYTSFLLHFSSANEKVCLCFGDAVLVLAACVDIVSLLELPCFAPNRLRRVPFPGSCLTEEPL